MTVLTAGNTLNIPRKQAVAPEGFEGRFFVPVMLSYQIIMEYGAILTRHFLN